VPVDKVLKEGNRKVKWTAINANLPTRGIRDIEVTQDGYIILGTQAHSCWIGKLSEEITELPST